MAKTLFDLPNHNTLIALQDSIERDPDSGDYILWGKDNQILAREKTREKALQVANFLKQENSAVLKGDKVQINGEVLPMSEYVELSSMQEYNVQ